MKIPKTVTLLPRNQHLATTEIIKHHLHSRVWKQRQSRDPFVKKAKAEQHVSRAVYKLEHMDKKHKIFIPAVDGVVIDLGASPGSWSQYVAQKMSTNKNTKGGGGLLLSVDLLPLTAKAENEIKRLLSPFQFSCIQGDFTDVSTQQLLREEMQSRGYSTVDVVLSDMAPNMTGDNRTDALKTLSLIEDALSFASQYFKEPGSGVFLAKYFSCGAHHEAEMLDMSNDLFKSVRKVKPPASRKESAEMYLLCKGFRDS